MPYFSIRTNQNVDESAQKDLLKKASAFVADLMGKPEAYVMISIQTGAALLFGGGDDPAAYVELKSIGLPRDRCPELSEKISGFIQTELKAPPNRVFIEFKDLARDMFGWNGSTF
ncbi:MAG: hypothetical protein GY859_12485 [Desulfobacterales bacterium]|nr:hypothetical protein [Desulfobacterales bacterium]